MPLSGVTPDTTSKKTDENEGQNDARQGQLIGKIHISGQSILFIEPCGKNVFSDHCKSRASGPNRSAWCGHS
jgi:hypothetical protein